MNNIEIYKPIKGFENYEVSNLGNVVSLNYNHSNVNKILKPNITHNGYLQVPLYKDGKVKVLKIHRLVADTFLLNPLNLPFVNHIDENKTNNRVDNLEWCTHIYNCNYGTRNSRISKSQKGVSRPKSKETIEKLKKPNIKRRVPIIQLTLDGEYIREWDSAKSASIHLGVNGSHISSCLKGKRNNAYGYKWKYA